MTKSKAAKAHEIINVLNHAPHAEWNGGDIISDDGDDYSIAAGVHAHREGKHPLVPVESATNEDDGKGENL